MVIDLGKVKILKFQRIKTEYALYYLYNFKPLKVFNRPGFKGTAQYLTGVIFIVGDMPRVVRTSYCHLPLPSVYSKNYTIRAIEHFEKRWMEKEQELKHFFNTSTFNPS